MINDKRRGTLASNPSEKGSPARLKGLKHWFRGRVFVMLLGIMLGVVSYMVLDKYFRLITRGASSSTISTYASLGPADDLMMKETEALPSSSSVVQLAAMDMPQDVNIPQNQPRMIIKTVRLSCEVSDFDEAVDSIRSLAEQRNGYIVSTLSSTNDLEFRRGEVTLRIPTDQFDATLNDIKQLAVKVERENISGNDVTEDYYDLTARLSNKQSAEQRYRDILRSARTVKDILEVEKALTQVREEIERLEGRKRYLEDQTSLSTITVSLHEPRPLRLATGNNGFWDKISRGLENGFAGFGELMSIGIALSISLGPFLVLFAILGHFGYRYYRHRSGGMLQTAEEQ